MNNVVNNTAGIDPPDVDEQSEVIYKEYHHSDGRVTRLTKQDFERLVDVFRMLDFWNKHTNKRIKKWII